MGSMKLGAPFVVLIPAAGLGRAGETFTAEQLKARFNCDLGPTEVDVSKCPKTIQSGYALFQRTCSQCRTPAREVWRR